jgi:hypothetical protein
MLAFPNSFYRSWIIYLLQMLYISFTHENSLMDRLTFKGRECFFIQHHQGLNMKHNIMGTNVVLLLLAAVLASAALSCQSSDRQVNDGGYSFQSGNHSSAGGSSFGGEPPRGSGMQHPELAESTELLLKIDTLISLEDPFLAITEDQGSLLIPSLREWRSALEEDQRIDPNGYMQAVSEKLSVDQAEYQVEPGLPGPPDRSGAGASGPLSRENGRPQGPPPGAGGPEERASDRPMGPPSDLDLLNSIIDKLS